MKRDVECAGRWQEEVWRVKTELAALASRMGMREYLAFVESEADRILEARTKPSALLARDKPAAPKGRKP